MLKNGFDRRGWCLNTLFCAFSLSEEPIKPGPYRVSKRTLRCRVMACVPYLVYPHDSGGWTVDLKTRVAGHYTTR